MITYFVDDLFTKMFTSQFEPNEEKRVSVYILIIIIRDRVSEYKPYTLVLSG